MKSASMLVVQYLYKMHQQNLHISRVNAKHMLALVCRPRNMNQISLHMLDPPWGL